MTFQGSLDALWLMRMSMQSVSFNSTTMRCPTSSSPYDKTCRPPCFLSCCLHPRCCCPLAAQCSCPRAHRAQDAYCCQEARASKRYWRGVEDHDAGCRCWPGGSGWLTHSLVEVPSTGMLTKTIQGNGGLQLTREQRRWQEEC